MELEPFTYCYDGTCADGVPPQRLVDVGSADALRVTYLPGWEFSATFVEIGVDCPREQVVDLEANGDGTHTLEPAGPQSQYRVVLQGEGSGDVVVALGWSTPVDGVLPSPENQMTLLGEQDGRLHSDGVQIELRNLRETPLVASAEVVVTDADGQSVTIVMARVEGCWPEGTVRWDGPIEVAEDAARSLGRGPYAYEVDINLDGSAHHGRAEWPTDEIDGLEPFVELEFDPPLPSLR